MSSSNSDESNATLVLANSIDDVRRRTGVGRTSIFEAIRNGDLQARKYGHRTVILDADLRAWLEGLPSINRSPPSPPKANNQSNEVAA
jgi:hypothetical protein